MTTESEEAVRFIETNIGFYNKINVINLLGRITDQIEYKCTSVIQEYISKEDDVIIISPSNDHNIITFMDNNAYNYIVTTKKSKEFIDIILKHCNGIFIGFGDDNANIRCKKIFINEKNVNAETVVANAAPRIYGVYFVCCYGNYISVIKEQLSILVRSGLYMKTSQLYIFICMFNDENKNELIKLFSYFDVDKKITLITTDKNLYEKFAINMYKKYIQDDSPYYFYYFHTKAVSRIEDKYVAIRKILNFYVLSKPDININLLNYYDAVGCSLSAYPKIHFSGNFWWAKSDYTAKLIEPIRNTYLAPEMYICSGEGGKFISLCQTTNNSELSEHVNKCYDEIISELSNEVIQNDDSKYSVC
jgi:hypothetical protein